MNNCYSRVQYAHTHIPLFLLFYLVCPHNLSPIMNLNFSVHVTFDFCFMTL